MKFLYVLITVFLASIYATDIITPFDDYEMVSTKSADIACTDDVNCNHGICQDNVCKCDDDYITNDDGEPCSYKQSSQTIAFLLEFLAGFFGLPGLGRIYLGYTGLGVFHLIMGLSVSIGFIVAVVANCCLGCIGNICGGIGKCIEKITDSDEEEHVLMIPACLCQCTGCLTQCFGCCGMLCLYALIILTLLASRAWWLADWIRILMGDLDDSDGYPLNKDL